MKVLVIGSGGREHAILWTLRRTSRAPLDLYCAPGNGGISELAECVPISPSDHAALMEFVVANSIDLTVVGPEAPLAEGIVDKFQKHGLAIVGPTSAAARLESSKAFAKDFMRRHNIPTADYAVANSTQEALSVLRSGRFGAADAAVVVKADGLAAGKGVIVARSRAEAERAIGELGSGTLVDPKAAQQIVIEEALEGREVSVLLFADGQNYALMPPARDHKRIGENDTGPNTGGMGAITDGSVLGENAFVQIVSEVVRPTLRGARDEGFPFQGILFVGLMLTSDGPKVLEYNVRFGDPETQAILIRLESDLLKIFEAMLTDKLHEIDVEWRRESSVCVVLASAGYPGAYEKGQTIQGLENVDASETLQVFHAGTTKSETGSFVTAGGRVLGVTATGTTLQTALDDCYRAVEEISWQGMQYRRDIGRFGLSQKAGSSESQH